MWLEGEYNDRGILCRLSSSTTELAREKEGKSGRAKAERTGREGAAYSHTNRWEMQSSSQYLLFLNKTIGSISLADSVAGTGSILVCVKEALRSRNNT